MSQSSFVFKEIDAEGLATLHAIEEAKTFNHWMYETILPHCSGKVLEIGSGIGNISECFIADGYDITLSDVRDNYCDILRQKFGNSVKSVEKIDLVDPNFEQEYAHLFQQFDTVFALNVVEHIENDTLAIGNARRLLRPNGKLIILVPAYQWLYNRFDEELEHYRRYTQSSLNQLFHNNQIPIVHQQYFNAMAIVGWFVSGKLQHNRTIPAAQMHLYDLLVPIFKWVDRLVFRKIGLSVIAVGKN